MKYGYQEFNFLTVWGLLKRRVFSDGLIKKMDPRSFQALQAALESLEKEPAKIFASSKRQSSHHSISIIPNSGNSGSIGLIDLFSKTLEKDSSSHSSDSLSGAITLEESVVCLSKKRKHSSAPTPSFKSAKLVGQQAVGNLSCRFASQVRLEKSRIDGSDDIMEPDSPSQRTRSSISIHNEVPFKLLMGEAGPPSLHSSVDIQLESTFDHHFGWNLTPFIQNRIENLAKQSNSSYKALFDEWMSKKNELENNLHMISSCPALDSYDDIKLISNQILKIAHWMCGDNFNELRVGC